MQQFRQLSATLVNNTHVKLTGSLTLTALVSSYLLLTAVEISYYLPPPILRVGVGTELYYIHVQTCASLTLRPNVLMLAAPLSLSFLWYLGYCLCLGNLVVLCFGAMDQN